jgi:hypothetical protein
MSPAYRPWGLLEWVLRRRPETTWSLLGCLSFEERSLAAWQFLSSNRLLQLTSLAVIQGPPSRFSKKACERIAEREKSFTAGGGNLMRDCHSHGLLADHAEIVGIVDTFLEVASPNVVLDMTSLPKRFFFPFVRRLYSSNTLKNLIVTYAVPNSYASGNMAENFQTMQDFAMFAGPYPEQMPRVVIAGVGTLLMGLVDQIKSYGAATSIKLLFPFPPGPPHFQRNLEFVRILEKNTLPDRIKISHVSATDLSDAFDHIVAFTDGGKTPAVFAPYGPKPISLAMCLFASLADSAVHYTQPRVYNPDYSIGLSLIGGVPKIHAYCLVLDGARLYAIPPQ